MEKAKSRVGTYDIKKSVYPVSPACANHGRFVHNHLLLCELQDKLELSLFLFCQKFCAEILERRNMLCYQAAELPALVEEIIRYCQDHKSVISSTGITPEQRDDFILDLHASRVIRNAAVHREPVLEATMQRLGDCTSRIISVIERVTGSDYHSGLQDIVGNPSVVDYSQRWLTSNYSNNGWLCKDGRQMI